MVIPLSTDADQTWNTPNEILEPIRTFFGGQITLDPCSNPTSIVDAKYTFDESSNGLKQDWLAVARGGLVFVNPPFKKPDPWILKCDSYRGKDLEIILLLDAGTDTNWFQKLLYPSADAVQLWKGRLKYLKNGKLPEPKIVTLPNGKQVKRHGGHSRPSLLAYWGSEGPFFKTFFSDYGICI